MIQYKVQKEQAYNSACGQYDTYGVAVYEDGMLLSAVEDISLDKDKVAALADRFNRDQLSPAHLEEMIETFLYDFEI